VTEYVRWGCVEGAWIRLGAVEVVPEPRGMGLYAREVEMRMPAVKPKPKPKYVCLFICGGRWGVYKDGNARPLEIFDSLKEAQRYRDFKASE
jgi:hypothetical protein